MGGESNLWRIREGREGVVRANREQGNGERERGDEVGAERGLVETEEEATYEGRENTLKRGQGRASGPSSSKKQKPLPATARRSEAQ